MSNDQTTKPIPVSAGQRIAEEFGYDQVVIVARKVGLGEHVTTYGVNKAHGGVAARMGNFFKHKLMGWPAPASGDVTDHAPISSFTVGKDGFAPPGDAGMPVVAWEWIDPREGVRVAGNEPADYELVEQLEPLVRRSQHLAAIASERERSSKLREEFARLQEVRTSVIASRDERIADLEADLREEQDRRQAMRNEWGAEAAALTAQARHAEDCLDAAKSRIAELEEHERLSAIAQANAVQAVAVMGERIEQLLAGRSELRRGRLTDPAADPHVEAIRKRLETDKDYAEQFLRDSYPSWLVADSKPSGGA